ncbi:hypothetical protein [Marinilabilia rubra]|uniref:SGNH/GDSL hydrolase family protein n=1 Tax=Marinilabilia rubra TaxID=2162893 RepID=A0A2U2B4L7_9BACT|nr:hypothetical protein [Marinilabilia rubra]PWD98021.1 hypothetical protein DDZ16_17615 [Marinilabilia rubra]
MIKLIKRLALFAFILGLLLFFSYRINSIFFNEYNYSPPDSVVTIVTGSSVVTDGINPIWIHKACNIALSQEPMSISYLKLRDLLTSPNNRVERVILSFSLIETNPEFDEVFNESRENSVEMFSRVSFLRQDVPFRFFAPYHPSKLDYFEVYLRNRVFPVWPLIVNSVSNDSLCFPHIGGFNDHDEFNTRKAVIEKRDYQKISGKYFDPLKEDCCVSKTNSLYLDSIINLTKKLNVDLFLVGMPMHVELYDKVPDFNLEFYYSRAREATSYDHVFFWDFSRCLKSHGLFKDHLHLSRSGADSISKMINDSILHYSSMNKEVKWTSLKPD